VKPGIRISTAATSLERRDHRTSTDNLIHGDHNSPASLTRQFVDTLHSCRASTRSLASQQVAVIAGNIAEMRPWIPTACLSSISVPTTVSDRIIDESSRAVSCIDLHHQRTDLPSSIAAFIPAP